MRRNSSSGKAEVAERAQTIQKLLGAYAALHMSCPSAGQEGPVRSDKGGFGLIPEAL